MEYLAGIRRYMAFHMADMIDIKTMHPIIRPVKSNLNRSSGIFYAGPADYE